MEHLLEFTDVEYSVGSGLSNISLSGIVAENGILNVRGPSGSGKTTFLRILARLKTAEGGVVYLQGRSWMEYPPSVWRRRVHYLAQKPILFDGSVLNNLQKPFELLTVKQDIQFNLASACELIERLGLNQKMLTQDARTLSGGEASRFALIRALLLEPMVLLLDEPLAALDKKAAGAVMDLVVHWQTQKTARGVVLVSHAGKFADIRGLSVLEMPFKEGDYD